MDEDLAALFVLGQRLMLYGEAKSLELTQEVQRDSSVIHSIVAELLPLVMGKRVMLTDLIAGSRNGKCGTLAVLPRDRARHQALVTEGRVEVHLDGGEGIRVRPRNLVSASVDPAVQRVLARMGTPCRGLDAAREWAKMGTGTDAEGGDVAVVRAVLDAGEIAEVLALAELQGERRRNESTLAGLDKRVGPDGSPLAAGAPLAAEIDGRPHDVCYSNQHIALYLHVDGYLQREHPQVWDHLLRAMCEQPGEWYDPSTPLRVRCIELHSYSIGGGLLAAGHRDHDSVLSMSVLLSDPSALVGGEFVTWSDRLPVAHKLRQGDAVLFHSCRAHNVAQVVCGVRRSLVIEVWRGETNEKNRFK